MTPAEYEKAIADVVVKHAPWGVRVCGSYDHARMCGILVVSLRAYHRSTGVLTVFASHQEFKRKQVERMTPLEVAQRARAALRRAMLHELDESIRVDGKPLFDPHGAAE